MQKNLNAARLAILAAMALSISACGGGGSDASAPPVASPAPGPSVPNPPPPPPPPPAAVNPDLVINVAPATYAAGTVERGAWDVLLSQRGACGFGLLNQDTRLDVAAAAHPYYLVKNTIDNPGTLYSGHFEDAATPYFYGVAPWDRAKRAGFPDSVAEIFTTTLRTYGTATPSPLISDEALGRTEMRDLINTVYHLKGAMWAGRYGGVGSANMTGPRSATRTQNMFVLDALVSDEGDTLKQKLGTGVVATYPCEGLSDVATSFAPADELPNPFPDVVDDQVYYGQPIYFKVDSGSTLEVKTARLAAADGSDVVVRTLTKASDPAALITANEFFMVSTTALAAASTYTVTASGTVDGVAFVKTFAFKTR